MTNDQKTFVEQIALYVQKYASQYGIKVHSPIIGQAIIESGWGKSTLSSVYHNYFGLKCGSKWTGRSVNLSTKEEYTVGTYTTIKDNFRVYDSMEEGVKGYFEFIQLARYANLKGITDPEKYIQTIKDDGYATSSTYVSTVMKAVTAYNLTQYDTKKGDIMGKYRSEIVLIAQGWIGCKESDGSHQKIIDVYNVHTPLARGYKVKYTDAWCATFVSACSIKAGFTDILPIECSCNYMIQKFKNIGRWKENDDYVPSAGDVIFYDWDDSGVGDNKGSSDHVGIVEKVVGSTITVIEGNKNKAVGRRTLQVNGRYIRGYGIPAYDKETVSPSPAPAQTPTKSVTASDYAGSYDKSTAGTYEVTASALNVRHGAGTSKKIMTTIPKGTKVQNFGYYTKYNGTRWLYIQFTKNGVKYTGFTSEGQNKGYLKKC